MTEQPKQLDPTALSVEDAARVLSSAGPKRVEPETIRKDIDAGAPTNSDGTINLVHYTAWIVMEMGHSIGKMYGD